MKAKRGCRPYLGKYFSDAGDAHGTVPRSRKVFPDGALASAILYGILQQPLFVIYLYLRRNGENYTIAV